MTQTQPNIDWAEIQAQLSAPFSSQSVHWRVVAFNAEKTMARVMPYVDARAVIDRLNQVVGVGNWTDAFREVKLGDELAVECTLTINGVSKSDVGVAGSDEDSEDGPRISRAKTAYSDARKRAAVPFGIGRYLYDLGAQWVPYDAVDDRLLTRPFLPDWALPEDERGQSDQDRVTVPVAAAPSPVTPPPVVDELAQAHALVLPFGTREHPEYKGRPLGELAAINGELIAWLATNFTPNTEDGKAVKRAAGIIARAKNAKGERYVEKRNEHPGCGR